MDNQAFWGEARERGTGSRTLGVAALVSLIIHGGIFLAYAVVYKDAGALKNYEPLQVALVLPAELGKLPAPPLASAQKKTAPAIQEDQKDRRVPITLREERKEISSVVEKVPLAEAVEAVAFKSKDQGVGDLATAPRAELDMRSRPETGASPVAANAPASGFSNGKIREEMSKNQGNKDVTGSPGEMPRSGYARLETSRAGVFTSAVPRYRENVLPAYPLPARRRGYAGVVTLSVEVLADGRVGRLEMKQTSGYDLLDKSARETVKGWKFSPGKKMGTPVTMWVDVPVRFELN